MNRAGNSSAFESPSAALNSNSGYSLFSSSANPITSIYRIPWREKGLLPAAGGSAEELGRELHDLLGTRGHRIESGAVGAEDQALGVLEGHILI